VTVRLYKGEVVLADVPLVDSEPRIPAVGRPPGRKTKTVRLYADLVEEVNKMCDALGLDSAEFLDSIIRPALEKRRAEAIARLREQMDALSRRKKNGH
jgi:hypothetical protein